MNVQLDTAVEYIEEVHIEVLPSEILALEHTHPALLLQLVEALESNFNHNHYLDNCDEVEH